MTVEELIEKLKEYPQDATVCVDENYHDELFISSVILLNENKVYVCFN